MKKELIFDANLDYEENIRYFTFNVDLLSDSLAKLVTCVEGEKFISRKYQSDILGHSPSQKTTCSKSVPECNFAQIIVKKEDENIDYMENYKPWARNTFIIAYFIERDCGFSLYQESGVDKMRDNMIFTPYNYVTKHFNKIPRKFDYAIVFLNYVIARRFEDKLEVLTEFEIDNYLIDFIALYLEQIRDEKITRLQKEIDKLNEETFKREQNIQYYQDLNNLSKQTRTRN